MPPSNANSFLAELAYDLEALRAMKREVGTSSEARQTVDAESRKDGGSNAKDALRSATASWLLGRTDRALTQLENAGDAPQAQLVRGLSRM